MSTKSSSPDKAGANAASVRASLLTVSLVLVPVAGFSQAVGPSPTPVPTPLPRLLQNQIRVVAPSTIATLVPFRNDGVPTLSVSGTASITRKADRATATISVSVSSASPEDVLADLTTATGGLERAIEHLHGTHVSVTSETMNQFQYYGNASALQQLSGSAQLEVTANDLTSLPGIRSIVASTPGATIANIRYDVNDRAGLDAEALTAALADLKTQVDSLVAKSNLKLGRQRSLQANVVQPFGNELDAARIEATATATYEVAAP